MKNKITPPLAQPKPANYEGYGRSAHMSLDAWARGFMVGVLTGGVLAIGILWAISGPLR